MTCNSCARFGYAKHSEGDWRTRPCILCGLSLSDRTVFYSANGWEICWFCAFRDIETSKARYDADRIKMAGKTILPRGLKEFDDGRRLKTMTRPRIILMLE